MLELQMRAVIQAGGRGARLMPYTTVLPKPLMPVGAQPVLALLLTWLRRNGTKDAYITTGYLGHLIKSFCGDGAQWDMRLRYVQEREPLGTIGGLSLVRDELHDSFLVINGDVLTDLNLNEFSAAHKASGDLLTVATAPRVVPIDFGVIESENGQVVAFKEKPSLSNMVSMGIYCMRPEILNYVPLRSPFGFDDLMYCMLGKGLTVRTFVHDGFWMDIGRIEDFQKVQNEAWLKKDPVFAVGMS
jgi:NDP-sugar pyrophosphorylase family protein